MSVIDTLIYDRTQADIDRLFELKNKILANGLPSLTDDEKTEYMNGMRGAYNYTDLNRVGEAVNYLTNRMKTALTDLEAYRANKEVASDAATSLPYKSSDITATGKTDWGVTSTPTAATVATYLNNLTNLRSCLGYRTEPTVPESLDNLTYTIANQIEYLLYKLDAYLTELIADRQSKIDRIALGYSYAGMTYSGVS